MSGLTLVWHYRDLRIEDNPALIFGAKEKILPLYIHSKEELGDGSEGSASKWWLHYSLTSLASAYKAHNIHLTIRQGDSKKILEQLLEKYPIEKVVWNYRYHPDIFKRDKNIFFWLKTKGIEVKCFEGNYLITPSALLNQSNNPYLVFTPFYKATPFIRPPFKTPPLKGIEAEKNDALDLLPKHQWADAFHKKWTPGRKGAIDLLHQFKKKAATYQTDRDFPALKGTSRLSPHLHFGEISPYEVWEAIPTEAFRRQLIWREFANYFLFHFPKSVKTPWREQFKKFSWENDPKHLMAWKKGMTGYPIVDAGMRQLWQTGWMHNRLRMIVASFLTKHLLIHWVKGAEWFFDTLVDADLANNTLGWQWVAGSGPDAAPYFRIFNPILQGQKFDPNGDFILKYLPELKGLEKKYLHTPWEAPNPPKNYPSPIVDHQSARKEALQRFDLIKS